MFITMEGIEGSGKTTQIAHISKYLLENGYPCTITREPGGTKIGEKIRQILLDRDHDMLDAMAELLLYTADRAQHVNETIKPALDGGKIVICDRFLDSTIAYQGAARGIDAKIIAGINHLVLKDVSPDITFLLDLPPETGLMRAWREIDAGTRDTAQSRFEREKILFHEKVRQGYLALADAEPQRIKIIDAALPPEEVKEAILAHLGSVLPAHNMTTYY
ncbi:MAG: dTMP kinase [Desulfosalsimonadaceae bacterium]